MYLRTNSLHYWDRMVSVEDNFSCEDLSTQCVAGRCKHTSQAVWMENSCNQKLCVCISIAPRPNKQA